MAKLFIFGIGGTGVRVIKSLVMLLAAGVDMNVSEVVPVIVDPHQSNSDLKRTIDLLENYQAVQNKLQVGSSHDRSGFFKTKITTLQNLVSSRDMLSSTFSFHLKDVQNEQFRDYVDYGSLDKKNKALMSLLFSEGNLETEMDIGFIGNPNIGSVVLNQFKDSEEFMHFASNFQKNDRIFVISSIFGGTGAAGFPTILKNIRNAQSPLPNHEWIRNAKVGAISLLPYFGVAPNPKSKIDKATFISKSKAALSYYERSISGINAINALYYLGDNTTKDYANDPGEGGQRNDAHFIELVSALSIIDFVGMEDGLLTTNNGKALQPVYKEFGVKDDKETIDFIGLGDRTQELIKKPLSQYMLFNLYLQQQLQKRINKQPWSDRKRPKINQQFVSAPFYQNHLSAFNQHFSQWLKELQQNKRAFVPFNMEVNKSNLFEYMNGIQPRSHWNPLAKDHFVLFDEELNKAERQVGSPSVEQKFMNIFYRATRNLLEKKFGI